VRQELLMPKLGLTMTEGSISEWCVTAGSAFSEGDCLYIVETEKITNEIAAEQSGTLKEIVVPEGQTVPVGTVVAYIETEGGASAPAGGDTDSASGARGVSAQGSTPEAGAGQAQPAAQPPASEKASGTVAQPVAATSSSSARIIATPLARRLARQRNIDLATLVGTGPGGRISARDVPEHAPVPAAEVAPDAAAATATAASALAGQASGAPGDYILHQPTSLQTTAAARLTEGKRDTPHFYLALEAEVSELLKVRKQLNEARAKQDLPGFTLTHFIVKAVMAALRHHPDANQVWANDGIRQFTSTNVGVAVNTSAGLMAPTVVDPGPTSLAGLAARIDDVVSRARDRRLSADDMAPAAITVSNAGMYNVSYMGSIINPGQSLILGVGSVKGVFRPDDAGQPALRQEMGLVLSADHRVTDGARALVFLNTVVRFLEHPMMLLAD